jgi:hypothetical protein
MKKQILALLGVGTLAYGSATLTFTETQAALTAPTNFNFSYRQSNVDTQNGHNWAIRNNGGSTFSALPVYTQTYDGQYYDYVHSGTELADGTSTNSLIVSHTFNNSSTSWSQVSGSIYRPNNSATAIGSNSSSGSSNNKIYININNQTNKDYYLSLDFSSTGSLDREWFIQYNSLNSPGNLILLSQSSLLNFYIPAYTDFLISSSQSGFYTSSSYYLDAWYLQDLGFNSAYLQGGEDGYDFGYDDGLNAGFSEGFDAGFSDGLVIAPIGVLFQAAFGAVASIFNIQVLGNLTLGSIIIAPIAVALLWFILGIVSGVGVGGKKK